MSGFEPAASEHFLPIVLLERLKQLIQTMNTGASSKCILEHADLQPEPTTSFIVVTSPQFSALLQYQPLEQTELVRVQLSFEPSVIQQFLQTLLLQYPSQPQLERTVAHQQLQPNDSELQSQLSLQLLSLLAAPSPYPSLQNQQALLHQVTTQIRQSLELPVILTTAVEQVRAFLQVDRLVIYQMAELTDLVPKPGSITYESLAAPGIPSVLNLSEGFCLSQPEAWRTQHLDSSVLAVADVQQQYTTPCLLDFLAEARVRAKLVTPIVVHDRVWGLLIAHQCFAPREWQEQEKILLQQIAEHLAIAIYQSHLYTQLQQQKHTLEERVIKRTQELQAALISTQSANRAKSDFLATMSHELRTPLTCVIGMSATLLRWSFGPLTDKQQGYLQTIHDSGEHLLELINDILDLSQVESGKAVLNVSEFSLTQLARQSVQIFREKAQFDEINLTVQGQIPPSRDRFMADRRRLKQILFNLLGNAVKFTPAGGRVVLRIWVEANSAVFQVEDTGIGIPKSQQPLLFQKFQQLDTSYTRSYEGTGLGLALTKQLVELHQGWISVESEEGQGATFTVEIPRQTPLPHRPVAQRNTTAAAPATSVGGRIVLIEDHEESAAVVCDMLTAAGYQVVWMIEGATAVAQIKLLQPLAVITDIHLPGMDGYEVIRQLREHTDTQHLKILVLTAKAMPADRQACLDAGADAYLAKPIQPEQLIQKINLLLSVPVP